MIRALFILALAFAGTAFPQMRAHDMGGSGGMQMGPPGSALAEGVVRKVDADAGKLTLRHDAIPGMDMPPMTMVYRVGNPAMLDQVKAGDKVRFSMERVGGTLTVTKIEAVR